MHSSIWNLKTPKFWCRCRKILVKKDMRSSFWNLKTPWILVRMLQNSGEKDVYPSIWNLKTPWFWYGCRKILVKKTPSVVTFRPRLASQEWLTWIIKDLEVSKGSFLSESLKWIKKNAKSLFWAEIWISCLLLLAENSNFLLRRDTNLLTKTKENK